MFLSFCIFYDFFRFSKKFGFWVFLVHPETRLPDGLETSGQRVYRLFWHISGRFWLLAFWMIFPVFQKKMVFGYSWSTLLWYRCYYPHRTRDALSPVCGIFVLCFSIKDQICLKLVKCFCCYSASTKTSFGFCSYSKLLQLKFGEKKKRKEEEKKKKKKMMQGNANCSAPKTVIGLTNGNGRYLLYLQLCGKDFFVNFMYWRCKSGPKLG